MNDDLLQRATAALRDETADPEARAGRARARLLDSAARQKRRFGLRFLVPFAFALGASTALAHVTHRYFPEAWNALVPSALERPASPERAVLAARPARKRAKPALPSLAAASSAAVPAATATATPVVEAVAPPPTATPVVETVAAPAPSAQPTVAASKRLPAGRRAQSVLPREPAPSIAAPEIASGQPAQVAESAELVLFRRAMKLQDAKQRAAVAAWDDFLRVAPNSPLVAEARYNRALGLVRAGRTHEARAALAPFARGDFAGYREREANELLRALVQPDAGAGATD